MNLTPSQLKALKAVAAGENEAVYGRLPRAEIRWLFHHELIEEHGCRTSMFGEVRFLKLTEFGRDTIERLGTGRPPSPTNKQKVV